MTATQHRHNNSQKMIQQIKLRYMSKGSKHCLRYLIQKVLNTFHNQCRIGNVNLASSKKPGV